MNIRQPVQAIVGASTLTSFLILLECILGTASNANAFVWHFFANFLNVTILGMYLSQSYLHSYRLWLATFTIFYIVGNFNIIIEALIFEVIDPTTFWNSTLFAILYSLIGTLILVHIYGLWDRGLIAKAVSSPRSRIGWIGRVLGANFLYIFFYITAGILVENNTPGFAEFYEEKFPPMVVFVLTNVFFRGFIFVFIAILIDQTTIGSLWTKCALVGLVFAVIGGIAPLVPPSDFMPKFIRVAHGIEVGISNFLYGVVVVLLIRSKPSLNADTPTQLDRSSPAINN